METVTGYSAAIHAALCSKNPMDHRIESFNIGTCNHHAEKKDPMKVWQEMKQNGFLTPSVTQMPTPQKQSKRRRNKTPNSKRELAKMQQVDNFIKIVEPACESLKECNTGVMPFNETVPVPKKRTKRCIIDLQKGNMKVAKLQKLNRFIKLAAPSGLLNELNPGIINRMRSSEQVFSVINSLVRRDEIGVSNDQNVNTGCKGKKIGENDRNGCSNSVSGSDQLEICFPTTTGRLSHMTSEHKGVVNDLGIAMIKIENENDRDEVK
ncbi:hypothetical protein RCOM_1163390 [Ricinus communis]|uniref:Uncharacterized protein n=1 Tax=Ricinus communis TaxID=3988 RepID=B9SD77_RICCO|nr:hypothetical protein RCOM_1163390 [Ricinus communis]